jgi:hypothetical protein
VLGKFVGEIEQKPPVYSAIKLMVKEPIIWPEQERK